MLYTQFPLVGQIKQISYFYIVIIEFSVDFLNVYRIKILKAYLQISTHMTFLTNKYHAMIGMF